MAYLQQVPTPLHLHNPCGSTSSSLLHTFLLGPLTTVRSSINRAFCQYEPIVVIAGTALLVHVGHRIWCCYCRTKDGALRRTLYSTIRLIPSVKSKVSTEVSKAMEDIRSETSKLYKGNKDSLTFITELPAVGQDCQDIIDKVARDYLQLSEKHWETGHASGTVYHGGLNLTTLNAKIYQMSTWTNPLHPDVFPGICKMEAEIVRIGVGLFAGGEEACGTVTSGGTESIILAVKAYRDYAYSERGVTDPEIVVPVTAHAAFDKAAQLLNIRIRHVPLDASMRVDVDKMKGMISSRTIMLVGSAPSFPHGTMDNITKIAALGVKYNIPVHTDACLGGFLLAFMPRAGFQIEEFDFRVKGITSISADTHKYGFAPKGSSLLLFCDKKYKHYQYFVATEWPGGLYASPTLAGSRPGAIIAGCWSTLLYFGVEGYTECTRKIIKVARVIEGRLRITPHLQVIGTPATSVVAFTSSKFDIYRLQGILSKKGWSLNALQFPSCIHFCVTFCHTADGVAEAFCKAVEEAVGVVESEGFSKPAEGQAAIYGTSQTISDRSIINEITSYYMDSLYETDL